MGHPVNTSPATHSRIESLDGFRAIAILAVLGFHYFTRWTPTWYQRSYYPYGSLLATVPVFRFGYLGVSLFFLVSGFVISMTLVRCASWREFAVRRFARLFPPMVLASVVTYFALDALPVHFWEPKACSFIPSLTFIDPSLYRQILGDGCGFIDGSYWSLWYEVRFYVLAALIYFVGGAPRFLWNSAIVVNASMVVALLEASGLHVPGLGVLDAVLFPAFASWLFSGLAFYFIWKDPRSLLAWVVVAESLPIGILNDYRAYGSGGWPVIIGIYALFTAFALHARATNVFGAGWLRRIGEASYSLYLLHQYLGVTLIAALAAALGLRGPVSAVIAMGVAILLTGAAMLSYRRFEIPMRRLVTRLAMPTGVAVKEAGLFASLERPRDRNLRQ